jgi:exodeoxyribonuclease V alpha subunit
VLEQISLEGILERIVYFDPENNFTVAKLKTREHKDLITIVGNLFTLNPGQTLQLKGKWIRNKKFGEEFQVESCLPLLPATITGIEKYLGSGLIKGIGPVMARRIINQFGDKTLDIIENEVESLLKVEGIGPSRLKSITAAWAEQKEIKEVMLFLYDNNISSAYAVKIYKAYREQAISIMKENPYRLALDINGIGFKTADKIAQNLGFALNSPLRAQAGLIYMLHQHAEEGHVYVPVPELLKKTETELGIEDEISWEAITSLIAKEEVVAEKINGTQVVYLKPFYLAEVSVAQKLKKLNTTPKSPLSIDPEKALLWVQKVNKIILAEKQREALRKAIKTKLLVITGGPGTGKTTLVASLIEILAKKGQQIILASPTGRAAKKLSQVTGKEAKTIHRLLEYSPKKKAWKRNEERPLKGDLIIVDEASMIDLILMHHLLKAIHPKASLILVGDADQLPSVGPGNVLRDIIKSEKIEVVFLKDIYRQAQESLIILNAHRVNQGLFPGLKTKQKQRDFYFIQEEDPEKVLETIKILYRQKIPQAFGFNPKEDIQVLTPTHKGIVGVTNLNRELQALLNPRRQEITSGNKAFCLEDKVMQIKNNYEKEVFNGDIGRVVKIDPEEQEITVAFETQQVTYNSHEMEELTLAYAISVHKSQGSEYAAVIMPLLTQHYIMLQRNLLYTAITRAKKLMVLIGSPKALAIAIKNNKVKERYTNLSQRLS